MTKNLSSTCLFCTIIEQIGGTLMGLKLMLPQEMSEFFSQLDASSVTHVKSNKKKLFLMYIRFSSCCCNTCYH